MTGAIIGDIVGSRFEFDNYRAKDFEFLTKELPHNNLLYLIVSNTFLFFSSSISFVSYGKPLII